ncbi:MAG: rRNA (guanine966-N2)-methyltransferase [Frankiales bacterium]|jgi:16S rRNA (guanine966-N2)-methyltransferase|nr:rRNA (guanine966-N2)-methyltransferase [Frankiales bacterium]
MFHKPVVRVTRIIAGRARGRRLTTPAGHDTRPTADRAREALFSSLESLTGGWQGRRLLDLYAGSGAVGLEALSRGAQAALMVEDNPKVAAVIRRNVADLALSGAEVVVEPVERHVRIAPHLPYDVLFADPPYALSASELRAVLTDAVDNGFLAQGAIVVVERSSRDTPWLWPPGIEPGRERRYGEATLWYGYAAAQAPE